MPRGRYELKAYLEKCLERVERVPEDEPWSQIRFPRQDAKKRIRNVSKSKRIVLSTDELGFSKFHARKEAWLLELGDNPTLFNEALDTAMEMFDLRGWLEWRQQNAGEQT